MGDGGLTPDQIRAATDAFKALSAVNPIIGMVLGIACLITTAVTMLNNFRTKKNTEANDATTKMLESHKNEMIALKNQTQTNIKSLIVDLEKTVASTKKDLLEEIEKVKIVVVKASNAVDQRLSMIPKVQDAIEQQKKRVDEILTVLTKGKGGGT